MKRFIWLVLLAAAGYAVWRYYPEIERRARERTAGDGNTPVAVEPSGTAATRAPGPPSSAVASPAAAPSAGDDIAARYPLPEFRPIEVLTGGWKRIPPSAFPRQVTLQTAATLQLSGGTGTGRLDAGTKVMAVSAEEGQLTITPAIGAAMRGNVDIDQTDFKSILGAVYEQFKDRKRAEVAKLRQQAREEAGKKSPALTAVLAAHGAEPPAAARPKIGPRPEQNADRTVPLMLASIAERSAKKKESEPKLEDIHGWGIVGFREVNGEPFWGGSVRYTAHTIFGEFPTEAVALIRHGRVERWIYSGTGEPVP
jgi:hypothetical protein